MHSLFFNQAVARSTLPFRVVRPVWPGYRGQIQRYWQRQRAVHRPAGDANRERPEEPNGQRTFVFLVGVPSSTLKRFQKHSSNCPIALRGFVNVLLSRRPDAQRPACNGLVGLSAAASTFRSLACARPLGKCRRTVGCARLAAHSKCNKKLFTVRLAPHASRAIPWLAAAKKRPRAELQCRRVLVRPSANRKLRAATK